jgi:hypothetical protein
MLVFIDESGDPGMNQRSNTSRLFVVTAVLFEEPEEAEHCDQAIERLRQELRKSAAFEFKFNGCCDDYREMFLRAVSPHQFFYHSFVLNKELLWSQGFKNKESLYKQTTSLVFENAKPDLRRAKVVIDRCGDRAFRDSLGRYLKRKLDDDNGALIREVKMEASHSNNLLQLADMVCGAVARSFNREKKDGDRFRKMISHRERRVQFWPKATK